MYEPLVPMFVSMLYAPLVTLPVPTFVFPFLIVTVPSFTGLPYLSLTVPVARMFPAVLLEV